MLRIGLKFKSGTVFITRSNCNSEELFAEQIKPILDKEDYESVSIVYPDEIKGVSIAFTKLLMKNITGEVGESEFFTKFSFESSNESLMKKIASDILF